MSPTPKSKTRFTHVECEFRHLRISFSRRHNFHTSRVGGSDVDEVFTASRLGWLEQFNVVLVDVAAMREFSSITLQLTVVSDLP